MSLVQGILRAKKRRLAELLRKNKEDESRITAGDSVGVHGKICLDGGDVAAAPRGADRSPASERKDGRRSCRDNSSLPEPSSPDPSPEPKILEGGSDRSVPEKSVPDRRTASFPVDGDDVLMNKYVSVDDDGRLEQKDGRSFFDGEGNVGVSILDSTEVVCTHTRVTPTKFYRHRSTHKRTTAADDESSPASEADASVPSSLSTRGETNGRSHIRPMSHVERDLLRLLRNVERKMYRRQHVFRVFTLQQKAFDFIDWCGRKDFRTFSFENPKNGKRVFVAADYVSLWDRYTSLQSSNRHYYEIIREGHPCHLYFDLEFSKELNPKCDGDRLVELLIMETNKYMKVTYDIEVPQSDWLELDSSTPLKFSRHLILRNDTFHFANNVHVSTFITALLQRPLTVSAASDGGGGDDGGKAGGSGGSHVDPTAETLEMAFVIYKDTDGTRSSFIDKGVYTKNRAFRMLVCDVSNLTTGSVELPIDGVPQTYTRVGGGAGAPRVITSAEGTPLCSTFPEIERTMLSVCRDKFAWRQKCHDPNCLGFTGVWSPLPPTCAREVERALSMSSTSAPPSPPPPPPFDAADDAEDNAALFEGLDKIEAEYWKRTT